MADLATRMKNARNAAGLDQQAWAKRIGVGYRSWQDYESGRRSPGSRVIASLVTAGINANWLLTGEGEMFLNNNSALTEPFQSRPNINTNLLESIISLVNESLSAKKVYLSPQKMGRLITLLYDEYSQDSTAEPDKAKIIKFIQLAS